MILPLSKIVGQRITQALFALPIAALLAGGAVAEAKEPQAFTDWPAGASPTEIGKRIAENYVERPLDYELGKFATIWYPEVCAWYGALEFAKISGNKALQEKLIRRFDRFLLPENENRIPRKEHVDARVTGIVPLEIYLLTGDRKYLVEGLKFADGQWEKTTPDGITAEARYWVDDIFMISSLQAQAYRATGDAKYLDRAALTVATYLDKLQQPNGLFFHAADSPFYWGRGCGWYAAGMAELLSDLPSNHPKYAPIMEGYQKMMSGLLKYQSKEGLWCQLVDQPDSWQESSGSAMFAYAMVTGVKRGWLDEKTFGPVARKAWITLAGQLDEAGNIRNVCVGTNKAAKEVGPDSDKQLAYYLNRARSTGDYHGQAPVLWTAAAMLR